MSKQINIDVNFFTRGDKNKEIDFNNVENEKINSTKKWIQKICLSLQKETKEFNVDTFYKCINEYLNEENKLERLLYSEISGSFFSLDDEKIGVVRTNIEKALILSHSSDDVNDDCKKVIIKIYDHVNLAQNQVDKIKDQLNNTIIDVENNAKKLFSNELKKIEREYIAILGIFASIVLAFVGGLTFSTSVLENMNNVSIYRLAFICTIILCAFANIISVLITFIREISRDNKSYDNIEIKIGKSGNIISRFKAHLGAVLSNISFFNKVFIVIFFIIFIAWILDLQSLANYIRNYLPY